MACISRALTNRRNNVEGGRILNETRKIASIEYDDGDVGWYAKTGYTIKPYIEPGLHGNLTYLEVATLTGEVVARLPAWKVTIIYESAS